jgi:integrase
VASARSRNGKWSALYRDQAGHQKSAGTYNTRPEALRAARKAEKQATGKNTRPRGEAVAQPGTRNGKVTVAGYIPEYLRGARLRDTTRETYSATLTHVFRELGAIPMADLQPRHCRNLIRGLEQTDLRASTVARVLACLRAVCRMAVEDSILDKDPTAGLRVEVHSCDHTIATPEQVRAIENAILPHYRLMVRTLFETGLRYGELMGIKGSDVRDRVVNGTCRGMVLQVRRTIAEDIHARPSVREFGKTRHAIRDIPITAPLASQIAAQALRHPEGWVFRAPGGGYLPRATFRRAWTPATEKAGMPGLRPHDLRHSHASLLVNAGVPVTDVRDRLGHGSLHTTNTYAHVVRQDTDPAVAVLEGIAS